MSTENGKYDNFVNSLIGEGTVFRGEVSINGLLRIDGDFSGSIKTKGKVFIGRNGRADCSVQASSVVIGGLVRGDIVAHEKVVILSSAVVIGSIQCPRLVAEEGVLLDGAVKVSGVRQDRAETKPNAKVKKGFFDLSRFIRPAEEENPESKILVSRTGTWSA